VVLERPTVGGHATSLLQRAGNAIFLFLGGLALHIVAALTAPTELVASLFGVYACPPAAPHHLSRARPGARVLQSATVVERRSDAYTSLLSDFQRLPAISSCGTSLYLRGRDAHAWHSRCRSVPSMGPPTGTDFRAIQPDLMPSGLRFCSATQFGQIAGPVTILTPTLTHAANWTCPHHPAC
jgi:hypothetical protein